MRFISKSTACPEKGGNGPAATEKQHERDGDPAVFDTQHDLALLYISQGNLSLAQDTLLHVLRNQESLLGTVHSSTLRTLHSLGDLYRQLRDFKQSETTLRRALKGFVKTTGPFSQSTTNVERDLGLLALDRGNALVAGGWYQRALRGKEVTLGKEHEGTLDCVCDVASAYLAQRKYTAAGKMYERAMQGREKVVGVDDEKTLEAVNALALVRMEQGNLVRAEYLWGRVCAWSRVRDVLLETRLNLCLVAERQGNAVKTEECYDRFGRVWAKHQGAESAKVLEVAMRMGDWCAKRGRMDAAEHWYLQALNRYESNMGRSHPDTLAAMKHLASHYRESGRLEQAERMLLQVLERQRMQDDVAAQGDDLPPPYQKVPV